MPKSFGLPCDRQGCTGRCRVLSVKHSAKDDYLRRIRICKVCGWKRRTIEVAISGVDQEKRFVE